MISRSARRADLIIANSESNKGYIVDLLGVPAEKIRIVPEGLDHDLFKPHPDREHLLAELNAASIKTPYILYVSGLWPYKNVESLIRAFGLLDLRALPHHLIVVGQGDDVYRRRLDALARATPGAERIHFLGQATRQQVARLMQAADVLVLPSLYESFGRVVTEAMACGTPVVSSDATSLPEVVGDAGLICSALEAEAYAEAISSVLHDDALRRRLTSAGLKRAAGYSWRRQAEMTVAVLEEVAA